MEKMNPDSNGGNGVAAPLPGRHTEEVLEGQGGAAPLTPRQGAMPPAPL